MKATQPCDNLRKAIDKIYIYHLPKLNPLIIYNNFTHSIRLVLMVCWRLSKLMQAYIHRIHNDSLVRQAVFSSYKYFIILFSNTTNTADLHLRKTRIIADRVHSNSLFRMKQLLATTPLRTPSINSTGTIVVGSSQNLATNSIDLLTCIECDFNH